MPITFKKQPVNSDINTLLKNLLQRVSRGSVAVVRVLYAESWLNITLDTY